jgi:mono/diheme cytochrome c family protein
MRSSFHRSSAARLGASVVLLLVAFFGVHVAGLWARHTALEAPDPAGGAWPGTRPALAAAVDGQKVYLTRCMSCHQVNGQGISGVFPPLAGAELVQGEKGRVIRIVLHGLTGETKVKGVTYNGAMPPWGTFLSDDEIAAVLTYVRSNWGNKASAVSAAEVASVRAATKSRKQPWTYNELVEEANSTVPSGR